MDLTPLRRHRDYRWLYAAQSVSFLGSMVTYVALPYQMWALTHSSLAVGMLGLVELLPLLVTAFVGGALADTVDRRKMVLWTEVGLALGCGLLAADALLPVPRVWLLYAAATIMSALNGLQRPSLESMTQRLVDPAELPAAAALQMFRGSMGMIAGPALGGLLIATVGIPSTFLFDLGTYAFSFFAVRQLRALPPAAAAERPTLESVQGGLPLRTQPAGADGHVLRRLHRDDLRDAARPLPGARRALGGPRVLGMLYAAPAVGALVASLTARWTPRVSRHGSP
jgi:MFS family permease